MTIEVTKKTFHSLFNDSNYKGIDTQQNSSKIIYWNNEIEQKGILLHNYLSNVCQYYLVDINA